MTQWYVALFYVIEVFQSHILKVGQRIVDFICGTKTDATSSFRRKNIWLQRSELKYSLFYNAYLIEAAYLRQRLFSNMALKISSTLTYCV